MESRKCPVCGRVVSGNQKKYCCVECALKHQNKMRMERRKANIEHYNEYQLAYYHSHKEKAAVRARTRYQAKQDGWEKTECVKCGSKENLQYHHLNYKGKIIEVAVLCKKCHEELHVLLNQAGE